MINLSNLADAFEERFDECTQYLNIKTGEAINVPNSPWTFGQEEYDQLQALVEDEDTLDIYLHCKNGTMELNIGLLWRNSKEIEKPAKKHLIFLSRFYWLVLIDCIWLFSPD